MEKMPQNRTASSYNELYSKQERVFRGGVPEKIVVDAATLLPQGAQVVEFGAGQGRNAIYLAEQGFNVTAIDLAKVGVETINKLAEEGSLPNLKAEIGDVRDGITDDYDMAVSTFMLHHLTREEALRAIAEIKEHTRAGGLNTLTVFTKEGDFAKLPGSDKYFYPEPDEMRELYSDWEVLTYNEHKGPAHDKNPDGSNMVNTITHLLARKANKVAIRT
jgi:tellurite methyltransferase